jgi:hypothetical protein
MVYRIFKRKEFDPEALRDMAAVFDDVCRELGLAAKDDALRDLVAETVIKCVQDGERDVERIKQCARNALRN